MTCVGVCDRTLRGGQHVTCVGVCDRTLRGGQTFVTSPSAVLTRRGAPTLMTPCTPASCPMETTRYDPVTPANYTARGELVGACVPLALRLS